MLNTWKERGHGSAWLFHLSPNELTLFLDVFIWFIQACLFGLWWSPDPVLPECVHVCIVLCCGLSALWHLLLSIIDGLGPEDMSESVHTVRVWQGHSEWQGNMSLLHSIYICHTVHIFPPQWDGRVTLGNEGKGERGKQVKRKRAEQNYIVFHSRILK